MNNQPASSLLREVARLHLKLQRACVASCSDSSDTQCFILGEVYRSGPSTLADLVRRLSLDKSWVSRAVENLVQEGLLQKEPHDNDRRSVVVSLSRTGKRRYEQLDNALNAQADQLMNRLSEDQRAVVYESLQLLLDALQVEAANDSSKMSARANCSK